MARRASQDDCVDVVVNNGGVNATGDSTVGAGLRQGRIHDSTFPQAQDIDRSQPVPSFRTEPGEQEQLPEHGLHAMSSDFRANNDAVGAINNDGCRSSDLLAATPPSRQIGAALAAGASPDEDISCRRRDHGGCRSVDSSPTSRGGGGSFRVQGDLRSNVSSEDGNNNNKRAGGELVGGNSRTAGRGGGDGGGPITDPRSPPLLHRRPAGASALPTHYHPSGPNNSTNRNSNRNKNNNNYHNRPLVTANTTGTGNVANITSTSATTGTVNTSRSYSFGRLKPALRPPASLTQVGPNVPQPMPSSSGAAARTSNHGQDNNGATNSTTRHQGSPLASPLTARGPAGGSSLSRSAPPLLPPPRPQAHSHSGSVGGGLGGTGTGWGGLRDLDGCVVWYTDDSAAEADIESMASVASVDSREVSWC